MSFYIMIILLLPLLQPQGGDYSYSGMHDHGPLPSPKEGGDFAKLIGMVHEAKKHSDEILTKLIKEENACIAEQTKKGKKQKVDDIENEDDKKKDEKVSKQKTER